jgi:hypothetical protein
MLIPTTPLSATAHCPSPTAHRPLTRVHKSLLRHHRVARLPREPPHHQQSHATQRLSVIIQVETRNPKNFLLVHTSSSAGGEVRGYISQVVIPPPQPTTPSISRWYSRDAGRQNTREKKQEFVTRRRWCLEKRKEKHLGCPDPIIPRKEVPEGVAESVDRRRVATDSPSREMVS